jgi:hypothetical protein
MLGLFERSDRREASAQLLWFLVWLGITVVAACLTPNESGHGTHQALGMPPCPSVLLFDRPCPGCGLTTSWTAFIHGNWPLAFRAHPLGPLFYLLFSAGALLGMWGWLKSLRLNLDAKWANRSVTAALVLFIGFGLIRMAVTPNFAMPSEQWLGRLATGR